VLRISADTATATTNRLNPPAPPAGGHAEVSDVTVEMCESVRDTTMKGGSIRDVTPSRDSISDVTFEMCESEEEQGDRSVSQEEQSGGGGEGGGRGEFGGSENMSSSGMPNITI
jgi:hypothetical protein